MDLEKSEQSTVNAQAESVATDSPSNNGESVSLDPRAIRKLRLKMDLVILPTLAIMYTFKCVFPRYVVTPERARDQTTSSPRDMLAQRRLMG